MNFPLPAALLLPLIDRALAEDLGDAGDLSAQLAVAPGQHLSAMIRTRRAGVLSGGGVAAAVFARIDPTIRTQILVADGAALAPGDLIMKVEGPVQSILTAERAALNFLGHMSGIATATAALVTAIAGTKARIAATRKTLPGLRAVQKYAVICGGGLPHRYGLHDAIMIKDNHIAAAGGIAAALGAARARAGHTVRIEIEVDTLEQLAQALAAGAELVLLDNMDPATLRQAVAMTAGRAVLEASGNVRLETVRAIAETGVDVISSGAITHSVTNLDIGLDITDAAPR